MKYSLKFYFDEKGIQLYFDSVKNRKYYRMSKVFEDFLSVLLHFYKFILFFIRYNNNSKIQLTQKMRRYAVFVTLKAEHRKAD